MANERVLYRLLFDELNAMKLFEYGAEFDATVVRGILGIDVPTVATKAKFDQLALQELAAMDYCRNILLGRGKYLSGANGGYRVLLPSENRLQVNLYMESADKKLSRALKLSRNSPSGASEANDQLQARIHLKRSGMRGAPGLLRKGTTQ